MDTLPLPPRPSLAQYKKRAKDLVAAANSKAGDAVRAWAADWLASLARLRGEPITPFVQGSFDRAVGHIAEGVREKLASTAAADLRFRLADAQFLIALAHGFKNWAEFSTHVERLTRPNGDAFEMAADAVVGGDLSTLEALVHGHPELIRARSTRVHKATLLHYIAANGVEDFRQQTPPNAVAIARFLLEADAEVDALANTYGGGRGQTTMNLLVSSAHPAQARLQCPLIEVLLDFGAAINGLDDDGSPIITALVFGYGAAAETLARRGARADNILVAAALGRQDLVKRFVVDAVTLAPDARLVDTRWLRVPRDPQAHIELALVWAIKYTRMRVAEFLIQAGVDPAAKDNDQMTALHWAAATGMMDLIKVLLERGAPLEVKNRWGGTVLASTAYFAIYQPVQGVDYPAVLEALLDAGADVSAAAWAADDERIADVLRRHGARP